MGVFDVGESFFQISESLLGSDAGALAYNYFALGEFEKASDEARQAGLDQAARLIDIAGQYFTSTMQGSGEWDKDLERIMATLPSTTAGLENWATEHNMTVEVATQLHRLRFTAEQEGQFTTPEGGYDWEALRAENAWDIAALGEAVGLGPRPEYASVVELFAKDEEIRNTLEYFNPANGLYWETMGPIAEDIGAIPGEFEARGEGVLGAHEEGWEQWGPETYGEEILDEVRAREAAGLATSEDILALAEERVGYGMEYLEGYGEQAREDISQSWQNRESQAMIELGQAGLGGTFLTHALGSGYERAEQADVNRLDELLAMLNMETYTGLTGEQLDIMGQQQGVASGLSGDVINQMTYGQAIGLSNQMPGLLQTQQFGAADVGFAAGAQLTGIGQGGLQYGTQTAETYIQGLIAAGMAPHQAATQAYQLMYQAESEAVFLPPAPPNLMQLPSTQEQPASGGL